MNITLRQLEHALALARHGSFRRAAREEHISQPAFSRSILNLEQALGVALFERAGPRATPTVFGQAVLRHAATIIDSTASLNREIDELRGLEKGSLRVALGTFPAELSAAEALGELTRRLPDIRLAASVTGYREVEKRVLQQAVDLGIADIGNVAERDRFHLELIGQHELVFFCRPCHPLVGSRQISISDLEAYPLAWPRISPRVQHFRPYNSIRLKENGDLQPHVEVEHFNLILAVVRGSDTLGATTPVQIETPVRNGELHILPFRAPWMALEYGSMVLRGQALSPAATLYLELIREREAEISGRNKALVEEFLGDMPRSRSRC
jgi:DNA-binding transcriptional LysR family regulator